MIDSLTERTEGKPGKTQFILTGFSQTAAIRLYAFEGIGDGQRADYTVKVDLALIPNYGIRIQDLPLLCRELLQQRGEPAEVGVLTFSEEEMRALAAKRAAEREEAAQRKKPNRFAGNAPSASPWRSPPR